MTAGRDYNEPDHSTNSKKSAKNLQNHTFGADDTFDFASVFNSSCSPIK